MLYFAKSTKLMKTWKSFGTIGSLSIVESSEVTAVGGEGSF